MSTFANDTNILEYEPDIQKYGIAEFDSLHEKSYNDIIRLLNIKWFPKYDSGSSDISIIGTSNKLSPSRLTTSQFTRAAVYHVLANYIYPRLSTFDPDGDTFNAKRVYYEQKFETEFDLILRAGVEYDIDSSGSITNSERQTFHFNRLVR
tara:strand:- start:946 stop:1395 length:450 start_codon:yes stop_codon:yes gene_type:complete